MDFVLTTAGLQALINVSETGTNAIELTHIGIGSGKYTPTKAQTALQSQIKTLRSFERRAPCPLRRHLPQRCCASRGKPTWRSRHL